MMDAQAEGDVDRARSREIEHLRRRLDAIAVEAEWIGRRLGQLGRGARPVDPPPEDGLRECRN